jgi:hypothetical protein
MPGTRPGMTSFEESARYSWLHYESDSQDEGRVRCTPDYDWLCHCPGRPDCSTVTATVSVSVPPP